MTSHLGYDFVALYHVQLYITTCIMYIVLLTTIYGHVLLLLLVGI